MPASSEIVGSGREMPTRAPEKSNFSHTFNLLSQYLKENGSLGDLSLGMGTSTMNLFPVAEKSGPAPPTSLPHQAAASNKQVPKKQPESAQMTIFYAGQVIVVDDFPADKAMEIVMLAGKPHAFQPASDWVPKPGQPVAATHKNMDKEGVQPVGSDLPIARKASLTRFLEKRKERITGRGPYQVADGSPSKAEEGKAWLGMGLAAATAAQSGVQLS